MNYCEQEKYYSFLKLFPHDYMEESNELLSFTTNCFQKFQINVSLMTDNYPYLHTISNITNCLTYIPLIQQSSHFNIDNIIIQNKDYNFYLLVEFPMDKVIDQNLLSFYFENFFEYYMNLFCEEEEIESNLIKFIRYLDLNHTIPNKHNYLKKLKI